jgi:hypothetical protein
MEYRRLEGKIRISPTVETASRPAQVTCFGSFALAGGRS